MLRLTIINRTINQSINQLINRMLDQTSVNQSINRQFSVFDWIFHWKWFVLGQNQRAVGSRWRGPEAGCGRGELAGVVPVRTLKFVCWTIFSWIHHKNIRNKCIALIFIPRVSIFEFIGRQTWLLSSFWCRGWCRFLFTHVRYRCRTAGTCLDQQGIVTFWHAHFLGAPGGTVFSDSLILKMKRKNMFAWGGQDQECGRVFLQPIKEYSVWVRGKSWEKRRRHSWSRPPP